jgi:hypothetical protein
MKKIAGILVVLFLISGISAVSFAQNTNTTIVTKSEARPEVIRGKIVSIDMAKNEIVVKVNKTGAEKTIIADPTVIASLKVKEEVRITLKTGSNVAEKVKNITPAVGETKKAYKK